MSPKKPQKKETKRKKKRKSPSQPVPPEKGLSPESLMDVQVVGTTVPQWRTGD